MNETNKNTILNLPIFQKNREKGRIVALGYFDGVHRGHQEILRAAMKEAHTREMLSAVHSFTTPPVSKKNENIKIPFLLTVEDEKMILFEKQNIDEVFLTPFEKSVEQLSPEEFLNIYMVQLFGARAIVTGEDYRFGKDREGDVSFLHKWGAKNQIEICTVPALQQEEKTIASAWIRELLRNGEIETANDLLGYPVSFSGEIEKGYQIGRTIQFPTANMRISPEKIIPRHGVYASIFKTDNQFYPSISNIGIRPTMNRDEKAVCLETMLFDQNLDLYGKQASVFLLHFIREEMHFNSIDTLSMQMKKDALQTREYHNAYRSAYSVFFPTML